MILCKANNCRKVRLFDSLGQEVQALETRTLMAVFSANGGKGGTSGPLALEPGLNLVQFQWQNFSIPDEFQIDYQGKRIAGDIGLRPNGEQGSKVIALKNTGSNLNIKVTAPLEGTAWNFRVETKPFELKVDGFLGDVIKVDIVNLLNKAGVSLPAADFKADGFGLKDLTFDQGEVARIDGMQDELKKGVFYFVPKVTGEALDYGANRADKGLGDITLTATNNGQEFPIKLHVSDGFSSTGDNAVTFGDKKLDIYRQEQRLAYLGFPGKDSLPLNIDGVDSKNLTHAKHMFSVATAPNYPPPGVLDSGTKYFKAFINSNAPEWIHLTSISGVKWYSQRTYGFTETGDLLAEAKKALGISINAGGSAVKNGTAGESKSHDAGRGFDIDNIPDKFLFKQTRTGFVKAPGDADSIAVKDGDTYRIGSLKSEADKKNAVTAAELNGSKSSKMVMDLYSAGCLELTESETSPQNILQAFVNSGATRIYYNDPRFIDKQIGNVTVEFWSGHFNHMHFNIASPTTQPPKIQSFALEPMSEFFSNPTFMVSAAAAPGPRNLGSLRSSQTITGQLNSSGDEVLYQFDIGDPNKVYSESTFYDTLRDVEIDLTSLSANADLQLADDFNSNGVIEPDEILYDSSTTGNANETIKATQIATGTYLLRVVSHDGQTPFNLSLAPNQMNTPPDQAGETATTAASLGILTSPITRNDFIGEVDPQDLYNFQIDTISDVTLKVTGLDLADATLAVGQDTNGNGLLDSEEYISYSDADDNGDESIQLVRLPAGKYLLLVGRNSGNSNYQLNAAATSSVIPSDQAGDTTATSYDFGVLTAPVATTDFIGALDRVDTYRFRIDALQGIKAKLSSLTADADLEIYRDSNSDGLLDANERIGGSYLGGDSSEEIAMTGLAAGEYFIRVIQYESDSEYTLNVSPETATGANLVITRDYPGTTPDLGTQFAYRVTVTNNGPVTATDVILTEDLPVGLHLVRVDNINPSSSSQTIGNRITGRISSLEPGASASFDITAYAFIAGDLIGITNVASSTPDFDLSSNNVVTTNAINSIVSPPADLELTQSVSNQTPKVGDQITINLSLTNKGPGTATVIRVRDLLPAGLGYISFNSDIGTYDPITGLWAVGNLPPDVTVNLQISAEVIQAVSMTNTVEVVAMDEADPDSIPNNNKTNEDDQSSTLIIPVGTPVEVALNVTKIERYGIHYQPTKLVLTFSTQLDTLSAQNKANYRILGPGGRYIPLSRATYQTSTTTVTLFPKLRLNLHKRYTLIVNGAQPTGLHTAQGAYLNHGTNHVAKIVQGNLVLPKIKKPQPVLRVALNAIKSKPIPSGKIIRALR